MWRTFSRQLPLSSGIVYTVEEQSFKYTAFATLGTLVLIYPFLNIRPLSSVSISMGLLIGIFN